MGNITKQLHDLYRTPCRLWAAKSQNLLWGLDV